MAGHNKWSQIKHRKGAKDAKKSTLFTKLLGAISIAAKSEPNPDKNPRLRGLIENAKAHNVPRENIDRALMRAKENKELSEFIFEAYGPEGVAILVEAITDNGNRTNQQLRMIAEANGAKPADTGSVLWAFEKPNYETGWISKFPQDVSEDALTKLRDIKAAFEEHKEVQQVKTNANSKAL